MQLLEDHRIKARRTVGRWNESYRRILRAQTDVFAHVINRQNLVVRPGLWEDTLDDVFVLNPPRNLQEFDDILGVI